MAIAKCKVQSAGHNVHFAIRNLHFAICRCARRRRFVLSARGGLPTIRRGNYARAAKAARIGQAASVKDDDPW
jgi:hypothetical protein